mmetsp:Transcript_9491/g.34808  ORF Transcript_9491/g.34808 Transcript_9491/m.34808 type:complete len:301 (-) Transcript_9491:1059-1961(-)
MVAAGPRRPKAPTQQQSALVKFDGELFRIGEEMIVTGKPLPLRTKLLALAVVGVAAYTGYGMLLLAALVVPIGSIIGFITVGNLVSKSFAEKASAKIIPVVMQGISKKFRNVRGELLKGLKGKVLDLGAGGGAYLPFAVGKPVTQYVAVEPNEKMHAAIAGAARDAELRCPLDVRGGFLQDIVGENGTYDAIILGNVLCEVHDVRATLQQLDKLLRPDTGRIYFSEHVLDEDQTLRRLMQHLLHPWWVTFSNGCNCNRRTLHLMRQEFGTARVKSWTFYAGGFPWTARFEVGLVAPRGES